MTLHKCKGLEFSIVFIVGVEKGILPAGFAFGSKEEEVEKYSKIEEERRLFYVGITRAMKFLHLVVAKTR